MDRWTVELHIFFFAIQNEWLKINFCACSNYVNRKVAIERGKFHIVIFLFGHINLWGKYAFGKNE